MTHLHRNALLLYRAALMFDRVQLDRLMVLTQGEFPGVVESRRRAVESRQGCLDKGMFSREFSTFGEKSPVGFKLEGTFLFGVQRRADQHHHRGRFERMDVYPRVAPDGWAPSWVFDVDQAERRHLSGLSAADIAFTRSDGVAHMHARARAVGITLTCCREGTCRVHDLPPDFNPADPNHIRTPRGND